MISNHTFRALAFLLSFAFTSQGYSAAAKPSVDTFIEERTLMHVSASPDGRYIASLWSKNDVRTVVIQDMSKAGSAVGSIGGQVFRPSYMEWANNERLLVTVSIPANALKAEKRAKKGKDVDIERTWHGSRTMAMDPDGSNRVILFGDTRHFKSLFSRSFILNHLPKDKEHIQMQAIRGYFRGDWGVFKVNIYTGKTKPIIGGDTYTYRFGTDENGTILYRYDYRSFSKTIRVYKYTEDQQWQESVRLDMSRDTIEGVPLEEALGVHEDGALIYRKLNENTGFYELAKRNTDGKTSLLASPSDKDVLGVIRQPYGSSVIGYRLEQDNVIRNVYFDPKQQEQYDELTKKLKALGFSAFYVNQSSIKSDIQLVETYGLDDPGTFLLHFQKTGELKFYDYARPKLTPEKLGAQAIATYKTRDGQKIESFLLFPAGYKPGNRYPMVMMPHGGPQARDYAYYDHFAQFLATRGYFVMKPNFRGSTGYGKAFEEAGYGEWGGRMQQDVEDGVNFAVKKGFVNPDKVCILGISYGGYAALMGAQNTEGLFQCSVSINGVTHLAKLINYEKVALKGDYPRILDKIYRRIGHPKKDKTKLKSTSPALNADKINIPVLLIGGHKDKVVPFTQQKMMRKALRKQKKEHQFLELKETYHNPFSNDQDREKVYRTVDAFLAKHL